MIKIMCGDRLGEKFLNDYIAENNKSIKLSDDYTNFTLEQKHKFIAEFLECISKTDFTNYYNTSMYAWIDMQIVIVGLKYLEKQDNKNVLLIDPLSILHDYYIVKLASSIVKLHNEKKHNFTIITNNMLFIDHLRANIATKKLINTDLKIQFYWKGEYEEIYTGKGGYYDSISLPYEYDDIRTTVLSDILRGEDDEKPRTDNSGSTDTGSK